MDTHHSTCSSVIRYGLLLAAVTLLPAQRLERTILLPDTLSAMRDGNYIAVNPLNGHVFAASHDDSHIVVVDGNSRRPVAKIPVGVGVSGLLFVPELNRLYAGRYSYGGADSTMLVIDGTTNEVLRTIPITPSAVPVFFAPDRHKLYCSVGDTLARLRVVDTQTDSVIGSVAVRYSANYVAYNRQRGHIYFSSGDVCGVYIIDAAADTLLQRRLTTPYSPGGLCYSPTSHRLYVSSDLLYAYDDTIYQQVAQLDLNGAAGELLYDSLTDRVYCSNYNPDASIVVVNCADNTIHRTYALGDNWAVPQGLNPHRNRIFVKASDSTFVIDDNLDSVVASGPGVDAYYRMRWDSLLDRWYGLATNFYENHRLAVVDGATSLPLPPIRLGLSPYRLCFDAVNGKLYCAQGNGSGAIAVVTPALNRTDTIVEVGGTIDRLLLNPVTNRIYAVVYGPAALTVLDGTTNQIVTRIAIGHSIGDIVLNPIQNRIYAYGWSDSSITVVDGNSDTVLTAIRLDFVPNSMAFNPVLDRLYVSESQHDSIAVVDGATNSVISEIAVLPSPSPLAWNPLDSRLYCGSNGDAGISVIDCASGQEVRRITGPQYVGLLAINTVENKVYALCEGGDQSAVAVISADRDSLLTTLPAYGWPYDAGEWYYHAATNRLFICGDEVEPGMVEVIDGHSDGVTGLITVGEYPVALAADSVTGNLYVADENSSSISVIQDVLGIGESALHPAGDMGFSLAPNPCRGLLRIRALNGSVPQDIAIHDVTGRLVRRLTVKAGTTTELDLRDQHSGVYFVSTADPKHGALRTLKFLLAK